MLPEEFSTCWFCTVREPYPRFNRNWRCRKYRTPKSFLKSEDSDISSSKHFSRKPRFGRIKKKIWIRTRLWMVFITSGRTSKKIQLKMKAIKTKNNENHQNHLKKNQVVSIFQKSNGNKWHQLLNLRRNQVQMISIMTDIRYIIPLC